ncbi:hypothetical protein ACSLN1_25860, partial [Escherichia coli]|uniref:hypothetical protein n=1 Tax=Escherichia coli TaxID=562 RepID=UPI003EE0F091
KSAATILAAKEFSQVPAGVIIITAIIPTATASMRATPILITAAVSLRKVTMVFRYPYGGQGGYTYRRGI